MNRRIDSVRGIPSRVQQGSFVRRGRMRPELLVILGVVALLIAVLMPAILRAREKSRQMHCQYQLSQLGVALNGYHDHFNVFPAAAVWRSGPLSSLSLHTTKRIDVVTHDNWALTLLPYLDQQPLSSLWRQDLPIAAPENATVRETSVSQLTCPAETYHRRDNYYRLQFDSSPEEASQFARGNYGYNAGPESSSDSVGSPGFPGDHPALIEIDETRGKFCDRASGMGGINFWLSREQFTNGLGTLVALEELRAGIHPADPRGVWAFGQVGGSITKGHGVVGDDCGPNNQWHRADDIRGCGELHRLLGEQALVDARMPCVSYIDTNSQATARSQHSGGVNVLLLDGHVRFVSDQIDPGLWHVLHHRQTPAEDLVAAPLDQLLARKRDTKEALPIPHAINDERPESIENSLKMRFVKIPAGTFEMGVADVGFGPPPPECPAHFVTISKPFWLGAFEVTQQQYFSVMGHNPSQNTAESLGVESTADFPVESVSWLDAQRFCEALSASPEEQVANRRYRLPTEAEWEYACREGSKQPHKLPTVTLARKTGELPGAREHIPLGAIGRYAPNAFGIYDLRGNAWEWCQDWFDRDYYSRAPARDPQGPASGYIKIARGSDWIFVNMSCMNNVQVYPAWKRSPLIGFRVICEYSIQNN